MKQFFKFLFASLLGTFISFIIIFFILLGIFVSILSYSEKEAIEVKTKSLLTIRFDEPILDRTPNNPFSNFRFAEFKLTSPPGLNDILKNIEKAKNDSRIMGIYLELSEIQAGFSTIQEIRSALAEFKESGKFIVCYGAYLSQHVYYLSTVADEIYLNPEGMVLFTGLNADVIFIKGLLDKLDIEAQVIRSGKYKSAVEFYMREDLSDENRHQLQELLSSIWDQVLIDISNARDISITDLNLYANNLTFLNATATTKYNFVDGIKYKDEVLAILRDKLNLTSNEKINWVTLGQYTYVKEKSAKKRYTRDRIAVVYAQGEIVPGSGEDTDVGATKFSKAIRKARENKNVKAIVLRVNSPGGSLLGSEIIRREVELAAKEKPLIVSMGDLAASGGYWISCNADKIFAEQTTLTGSIGVYGVFPNFKDFLDNKLGITFDHVMTNDNSNFMSMVSPFTNFQIAKIQNEIDKEYQQFLTLVSESRNLKMSFVDSIAQGRIWSGIDAKRLGLIDAFGGLKDAINEAETMAGIKNYRIEELPEQADPITKLFSSMMSESRVSIIKKEVGDYYLYYKQLQSASKMEGMQARVPYYINIK